MINNLPISEDFYSSGKELLNFSWDIVATLLCDMDNATGAFGYDAEKITDAYWNAAKGRLSTALAMTQQGTEFILKGKITDISPYLLIADGPSNVPSPYPNASINFSDIRTIDAQDLIRVLDTFSDTRVPVEFKEHFDDLRKQRNLIMHSVDRTLEVQFQDVIKSILYIHKALFPNESWPAIRLQFLETTPTAPLGAIEYSVNTVCWELSLVEQILTTSEIKLFLGFDPKQYRYLCPECLIAANTDTEFDFKFANLRPKGSTTTDLYCPVCDETYHVVRKPCDCCDGNVLSEEDEACLSCSGYT